MPTEKNKRFLLKETGTEGVAGALPCRFPFNHRPTHEIDRRKVGKKPAARDNTALLCLAFRHFVITVPRDARLAAI